MPYESEFAALSHPTRQHILDLLAEGPRTVRALTEQIEVSQPRMSQHLKVLLDAGLVSATPDGAKRVYTLQAERLQALRHFLMDHWQSSLSNLTDQETPDA